MKATLPSIHTSSSAMPAIESTIYIMISAAVTTAASLLLSQMTAPDGHFILDEQSRLLTWSIVGGIGGGLLGVCLFPPTTIRQTGVKWLGSTICAGLFSPAAARFLQVEADMIYALALAGGFGLMGWGILYLLLPMLPRFMEGFLRWAFKNRTGYEQPPEDRPSARRHRREDAEPPRNES